jgi:acetylornithine deacetylase/succinyl-diaminopimelate desuccinylase-like protein
MSESFLNDSSRRTFLASALLASTLKSAHSATGDVSAVQDEIAKHHEQNVKRLQTWIRQPSIAAENRGMQEGCELMIQMLREVGFAQVEKVPSAGQPGAFGVLDSGAARTFGIYFMYDVKQADPSEWSSPPFDAALIDKPGLGKALVGRGAVNQKGPEATFLAALHAFKSSGKKLPVNLIFIAEGEEEIGSPHFPQIVQRPDILAAFKKCEGVFMPMPMQSPDGTITINLGAKGVIELELVSSAEKWGHGPKLDVHSSTEAVIDSPAWHLIQALNTLVGPDGHTPAIEGFLDDVRPLSPEEKAMIRAAASKENEAMTKKALGVEHWVHNVDWLESRELLAGRPTVNIEGLVSGYTGPGGKTILPHRAVAKMDLRLVPNMTAAGATAKLKAHLAKKGFADIEVNVTGGYDPTSTPKDSRVVTAAQVVYRRGGTEPILWPRLAGSWPGFVFTGAPLNLPATHFGLGNGFGAHAPNEYYVIESANKNIQGFDGAARGYIEYLYELGSA